MDLPAVAVLPVTYMGLQQAKSPRPQDDKPNASQPTVSVDPYWRRHDRC